MKFNHVTVLEYKYLFGEISGDKQAEILRLLEGLNFDLAFPIVARLNNIVRKNSLKTVEEEVVMWFGSKSSLTAEYLKRIAKGYDHAEHASLRLLNIWSNLTLLERFLEVHHQGRGLNNDNVDTDKTHENLFEAYLLINELYVASFNQQKILDSIPNNVGLVMKMGVTMSTMLLPYHDLNHVDASDAMISQFIKAVYFFQFAEKYLPDMLNAFLKAYSVPTWRDYFKGIFPIVDHALRNNAEGLGYLTINENDPKAQISRLFLSTLAVGEAYSEQSSYDFITLRSKPLMQINPDKYLVIDNLLLYNKMYNSLFFEFNSLLKNKPELFRKGDFKGYLNDNFSESFLANQVLNTIFQHKRYLKFSGEEIREKYKKRFSAEPDYYVRDNDKVFIFELKDTLVNGEIKQSFDVNRIGAELRTKFWFKEYEKDGIVTKISPKAIRQIKNNLVRLAKNELPFDNDLENKKLTVYPVLLYVDQSLSTPGINDIIQQWFAFELLTEAELGPVQERFDIMPLTMIDLDTLVLFQDDFKDGNYILETLIPQFWMYKQYLFDQGANEPGYKGVYESYLSFGAFLRMNRTQRRTPALFSEFGRLLFETEQ